LKFTDIGWLLFRFLFIYQYHFFSLMKTWKKRLTQKESKEHHILNHCFLCLWKSRTCLHDLMHRVPTSFIACSANKFTCYVKVIFVNLVKQKCSLPFGLLVLGQKVKVRRNYCCISGFMSSFYVFEPKFSALTPWKNHQPISKCRKIYVFNFKILMNPFLSLN
jgi:hypothetical protein